MSFGEEDTSEYILVAKLDNAKNLSTLLKAIHFKQTSVVFVSENGLKVTVEESKFLQASAFIQSSIFQEYTFTEESATFKIDLNVLLECLHIFGGSESGSHTALKMCYAGHGFPLKLLLAEDGGVLTECSINTHDPEEIVDFNFTSSEVRNKIIMKMDFVDSEEGKVSKDRVYVQETSSFILNLINRCALDLHPTFVQISMDGGVSLDDGGWWTLKDVFQEIDMTSDVIQLLLSPEAPYFRISTFGNSGSIHVDYPRDSEMIETFECQQTQSSRYKTSLLKPSTKALSVSSKLSIRMDSRGFLSLQYMILTEVGQICFVEYLCAPNEDRNEEEEEFF